MVLENVWDTRGGFVCGLDMGHDGPHRSRPSKNRATVKWQAKPSTMGAEHD